MVLKWTRTKPEPLKYFEQELNLNPNRYLKRFDTLVKIMFLPKKLQKLPGFWGLRPKPLGPPRLVAPPSSTICDTFEMYQLAQQATRWIYLLTQADKIAFEVQIPP